MSTEQEHFDAARKFQAHYDEILREVGARAPPPILGDTVNQYRRETLRNLKRTFLPQTHPLYDVQFRALKADALGIFEPQLLKACVTEANNPCHVPPGEMKKVERLDPYGQMKFIDWVGQEHFTKAMSRPGRRVVSFRTDKGFVDASGRGLR